MEGNEDITIDIDAAVGEIADGLGFESEDDGLGNGETVNEEVSEPAAPTGAATPATPPVGTPPPDNTQPATPPAEGDPLATPPRTWRPEAAADWANLPAAARAEIHKREEDMFKGIEAYKGDAAIGKSLKQTIGKYVPLLQQHGIDPMQQIGGLMDAHYTLAMGSPDQKLALFHRLAQDYGVNLAEAAVIQPPYVDPQVAGLQKELQSVKSALTEREQREAAAAKQSFEAEVTKFQSDPANIYFNELVNDMAELLEKGVASDIKTAYEKAVRLNPTVFAKEQARQQAEAAAKAKEEAAKKATEARKATGANVRSSAKAGSAAAPLGSIDDTLSSAYRDIMSRG